MIKKFLVACSKNISLETNTSINKHKLI